MADESALIVLLATEYPHRNEITYDYQNSVFVLPAYSPTTSWSVCSVGGSTGGNVGRPTAFGALLPENEATATAALLLPHPGLTDFTRHILLPVLTLYTVLRTCFSIIWLFPTREPSVALLNCLLLIQLAPFGPPTSFYHIIYNIYRKTTHVISGCSIIFYFAYNNNCSLLIYNNYCKHYI